MFLSVFKEKKLDERITRFFLKLENGKLKSEKDEKRKWVFDSIALTLEDSDEGVCCYFEIDYRSIYILEYIKEADIVQTLVQREEYLKENDALGSQLKDKIIAFLRFQ